jgi:hypothetical protein
MSGVGSKVSGSASTRRSFARADIDADILPELTEVDLEKLGVSLGRRKRLLRSHLRSARRQ